MSCKPIIPLGLLSILVLAIASVLTAAWYVLLSML
jgi:hypothetical protein